MGRSMHYYAVKPREEDYLQSEINIRIQEFLSEQKLTGTQLSFKIAAQPGQQIPPEYLAAHAAWVKGKKEVVELKAMFSNKLNRTSADCDRISHTCKQEERSTGIRKLKPGALSLYKGDGHSVQAV
ncbi:hypothetical protein Tco_0015914 [Tanacetum coccineum]